MTRAGARSLAAVAAALALAAGLLLLRNLLVVRDPLDRLATEAAAPGGPGAPPSASPASASAQAPAPGSVAHTGSWWFPRGGPYMLGFESPGGPAELAIDGRVVARGAGLVSKRLVYQAGAHAVRLVAPPGARLLWHPPGRRGPLEYVPPSSLASQPPDRASFSAEAGTSPADGVLAALLLAVAVGLALFLARARLGRCDRRTAAWAGLVFALALAVRLYDLGGAGQTWDEDVNWSAGRNYVTNVLALDGRPSSWQWNFEHPPVMKYVAGVGAQLADGYGPARALSALMMAAACALLVAIGRRLYSLRVGALAGAVAALTPHLVAHGQVVGHEAPSVLLWTLALGAALGAHDGLAGLPAREATGRLALRLAAVAVLLGLALWSRFANGLLAPLVGAVLLVQAPPALRRRTFALGLAVMPVVAVAVGFAVWPRLWHAPGAHLAESWHKLRQPHGLEPFLGVMTNHPPRDYFALYLLATAPLGVLLGAAAYLARAVHRRERGSLVVALWLAAPLLILLSPVRQDGVRYILPALAALALAAAAGLDYLVSLARARLAAAEPRAFAAAGALFTAYLALVCWRIHPYYLDYYGEQVGGPAAVARHRWFEVGWWGEGVADAVAYVNAHAAPGARVSRTCVEPGHLTWLRGDLWSGEYPPAAADWILHYEPASHPCKVPPGAVLVHEVAAQGAPIARVYRRAGAADAAGSNR